ncbi:MAG: Rv3654c family TadE-like protein [Kineosporiaceae bacterium]
MRLGSRAREVCRDRGPPAGRTLDGVGAVVAVVAVDAVGAWMRGSRRHRPGRRSDRGSGTVLALAIASVGVALALLVGGLGLAEIARHRATAAADLAALAAAGAEPPSCAVAADLARRNGARLGECLVAPDGSVTVTVGVSIGLPGAHQAVGRARAGTPGTGFRHEPRRGRPGQPVLGCGRG